MYSSGGLVDVTLDRVDDHIIAVKMGRHRVFDIVDGMAVHKTSRTGDTVFANPHDLMEKLSKLLTDTGGKSR